MITMILTHGLMLSIDAHTYVSITELADTTQPVPVIHNISDPLTSWVSAHSLRTSAAGEKA